MPGYIQIKNISFSYETNKEILFKDLTLRFEQGWTAIVGPNGSGKTTFLKLLSGIIKPDSGSITFPGKKYYAEQRTDFQPDGMSEFFNSTDKSAYKLKNVLNIEEDWQIQWNVLSHGERKRCQVAVALFQQPDILCIDEPSNHLDYYGKEILLNALQSFKGIGLLVSHDRDLMDDLCKHTIFIDPPKIELRKCNYSIAEIEIDNEIKNTNEKFLLAKNEVKKLKRKVSNQREKANRASKLKSKRNINPKDHDAKSKKDLARLSGKDAIEGQIFKRMQSKLNTARKKQKSIHFRKTQTLGITFNEQELTKTFPIIIPPANLSLGEMKKLKTPELTIQYGDKIGIVGNNGSGKSTFLNHFIDTSNLKKDKIIYITQEIPIEKSESIIRTIRKYGDDKKGQLMSIISHLGSDPMQILETLLPTPGEVRKLMLAEGIIKNPGIIIMDEPTNHMDLFSLECIEKALQECCCAQILVSHDMSFLKNTVDQYWAFEKSSEHDYMIHCKFN